MTAPVISFVIPAHNEERLLGATLSAVAGAAAAVGEPHEVIVVDDASTDATAQIAQDAGARVVSVGHRQIAATRNSGAAEAAGEWLVFVDADTLINAPLLRATVAALRGGAVGGGCRLEFEGEAPLSWRFAITVCGPLYHRAGLAAGCYVFARRDAFNQIGGFDTRLYASEEVVLSKNLRKLGRFTILREKVTTSGRKLRAHSLWEGLGVIGRLARKGRAAFYQRDGLDIWYGPRR